MDDFVWTEEKDNFLRENYMTMSYAKMGEILGIPFRYRNRVLRRCEKLGFKRPTGRDFNQNFFDEWSPNMAYILGYFCADGSMMCDETHYDLVFRCTKSDRELLEVIKSVMNIAKELREDISTNSVSLGLSSKHMCHRLIELGINTSKSKNGMMVEIPKEYLSHFVRGFIDGDGNVSEDTRRGYSLRYRIYTSRSSAEFLNYLNRMIVDVTGVRTYMRESRDLLYIDVSARDAKTFTEWLYCDAEIYLARKYKINYRRIRLK